ncbi:hypothetical protein MauCBS54593_002303 [Microsporum audouinii]
MRSSMALRATARRTPLPPLRKSPLPIRRATRKTETAGHASPSTNPGKTRPVVVTVTAVAMFSLSAYAGYLYTTYRRAARSSLSSTADHDVSDRYRTTAASYDSDVDMAERMMWMGRKRRELVRRARGDVLEVSAGTGRNIPYYLLGERRGVDGNGRASVLGCRSVTFVDLWPEMIDIARWKYEKLGSNREKQKGNVDVIFLAQDAMAPVEPPGSRDSKGTRTRTKKEKFDTVVQTMGLCSHPDPVKLLRHLGSVTEERGGQILLLEHGRGYYGWVNRLLDDLAPAHADRHGCWWNRDIGEIVSQSGLEVVESRRYHLGTTWEFVLRPASTDDRRADDGSAPASDASTGTSEWLKQSPGL